MRQFRFSNLVPALLLSALVGLPTIAFASDPANPPAAAQMSGTQTSGNQASTTQVDQPAEPIANLFSSLRKERDPKKARVIATEIVGEWSDSGSPTINLLMKWAEEAAEEKRNAAAYDFLDQAILLEPDYAQAWYRRALVHFADGEPRKAMLDLNKTLEKEPRFFPALASLANILETNERDDMALKVWQQYLALYPGDTDAQKEVSDLSEKLAGTRS